MTGRSNTAVVLAAHAEGTVTEADFRIVEADIRRPGEGEVLVESRTLSLDPYMRGRMTADKNYAAGVELGSVMIGEAVGTVVESRHAALAPGDMVIGMLGWQRYATLDGAQLHKLDGDNVPASAYLGVLGLPGVTAWYGLNEIGRPQPGETVVVSAASGAVGSVVGQLATLAGCRAVGIAGGPAKCAYVKDELGFAECVDYKSEAFADALHAATPAGVDVYFDNVGGEVLDAVLGRLNPFARIPLCGLISGFGVPLTLHNARSLLVNRARLQGLIVTDRMDLWPVAVEELMQHLLAGKLRYRESVAEGLENAPRAFIGLLAGQNFGKQLVRVS